MRTVLFLCTGNYYRSRFAEILFDRHAGRRGFGWRAASRGLALSPANVGPISPHTVARLASLGIPHAAYLRPPLDLTAADLAAADHIVAVKAAEHRPLLEARFSGRLGQVEFWDVHDVDVARSEAALPHLEREVLGLLDRLAGAAASSPVAGARRRAA